MKSKQERQYKRVLIKIKKLFDLITDLVISNIEKSLNNAILDVYKSSKLQLCYFHFTQSIWHRIQSEGLSIRYKSDLDFKKYIRRILSSAFLPNIKIFDFFPKCARNYPDKNDEK
ncbi:hypothetical protein DMUE_4740 [Dictyocoela muelleri]|nr:hypothetical protein DMUE_4740 [Dictyocoela muelleri]